MSRDDELSPFLALPDAGSVEVARVAAAKPGKDGGAVRQEGADVQG